MKKKINFCLLVLCLFSLTPFYGFTQPDIPMSADLKSNSESWKVKVKQNGIWGKKPAMVSFGPLKTISTETEKNTQSSKQVDRELFWKNIRTVKSSESSMTLELNGADTVMISMLTVKEETTKEKNVVGTLANVNGENEESYRVSSWLDEMILQVQNDSAVWRYHKLDSGSFYGILEKVQDPGMQVFLFRANNLEGKKLKDIMFSQPALGFIFEYQGKQVAACQTLLKQMFWVSNTLDPALRRAIMATGAAVMATVKSGDSNGY